MPLKPIIDAVEFGASCKKTGYMTFDSPTMCGFVSPGRKIDSDFDLVLHKGSFITEQTKDKFFIHDDHVSNNDGVYFVKNYYLIGLNQINSSLNYKINGEYKTIERDITKDYLFLLERN